MNGLIRVAVAGLSMAIAGSAARAGVENRVFTSVEDRLRLVVPRGWRETDAAGYPGLLLWMLGPNAKMVLTAEPFTRSLYCSWPVRCRISAEVKTVLGKFACALSQQLTSHKMKVGPVQAGPRENQDAGIPSAWFEYDDGEHFMRQAVALTEDRAISLVLSSPSAEARASNARSFETALRTLRTLNPDELPAQPTPAESHTPASQAGLTPVGPCTQR